MSLRVSRTLTVTMVIALAGGCDVKPETIESLRQVAVRSSQCETNASGDHAGMGVCVPFDATHPHRVDPFAFPDESVTEATGADTTIKSAANVDVVGFADLDQPRVFLRARDKMHSLKVGDSVYGVEVVEIRPPVVRLRMGNLAWTAAMFDSSTPPPQ